MNVRRLVPLAAVALLGLPCTPAAALSVTAVNATVTPASSHGPCPATFTFHGKVALNKEGRFTYRWERSDGAVDTAVHPPVVFDGVHGAVVQTTWTLGAAGAAAFHPFHGWMALHVLTPENKLSDQAKFTLDCGAPRPTLPPGALNRPTIPAGAAPAPK